jgi:flagellar basal-body rod protein FlgB
MLDKIDKYFNFQQKALDLRAYRTEVLAGNMANAETPYYKAVDFNFADAMKAQMGGHGSGKDLPLVATDPRHFSTSPTDGARSVDMLYRDAVQPSVDGNTVDMDVERGAFMDNALHYQSTLTFLNNRISMLSTALKDQ